ncbi:MAG: hypothetical protein J7L04_10400 [Bacteroidales bacterium]|nr:hypothetical protein [Bacteroidales bacterium]
MKSGIMNILKLLVLMIVLLSCKNENIPATVVATVETLCINSITGSSAMGGGEIISDGGNAISTRGICWDTIEDPTIGGAKSLDSLGLDKFTSQLSGLTGGTTYYVRAFATNNGGIAYGNNEIFATLFVPLITTNDATEVTNTSATSGGVITKSFGAQIIAKGVCWSQNLNPSLEDSKTSDGPGDDLFSSLITGLLPGTAYHVRSYVTTSDGDTGYGDDKIFITQSFDSIVYTEVIRDIQFEKGFALTPLDPAIVQQGGGFEKTFLDTLDFGKDGSHPVWILAQWNSKYDLAHTPPTEGIDGSIEYANEGKKIALFPNHSLWLEVDASKEYDSPRLNGQSWPHLLISQNFHDESPNVGEADRLDFSMEIKLEKCENKMTTRTYNSSIHTAQTPFYFMLVNNNKNSADYHQRIWFGLPSFDFRYPILRYNETVLWDIGTSTFIYGVPETKIWGNVSLHDGNWHTTHIDIKPLIKRALEAMKEHDVFRNTTLEDLIITSMNFGWEVPGTFDAAIRVRGISLKSIKLLR